MAHLEQVIPLLVYEDIQGAHDFLVSAFDDVDAHFGRARAAGAVVDSEPRDMPYGQREYGARDPEGHRWWFAARLPVGAPAE